jgi:hypothetical protein
MNFTHKDDYFEYMLKFLKHMKKDLFIMHEIKRWKLTQHA